MLIAPLKTFIIYARADEDYKKQLLLHLRPLVNSRLLEVWHDGNILPGEDWEKAIKKELKSSELVIVLVSVHSLNSDFIQTKELRMALEQLDAGLNRVVPILVSPCAWRWDPIVSRLQALPLAPQVGLLAVSEWTNANLAWTSAVEQIGSMVQEVLEKRNKTKSQLQEKEERIVWEEERTRLVNQSYYAKVQKSQAEQQSLKVTAVSSIFRNRNAQFLSLALLCILVFGAVKFFIGSGKVRAPGAYLKTSVLDGAPVTIDVIEYVLGNGLDQQSYFEKNLKGHCFLNPDKQQKIQRGTQITAEYLGTCAGVYPNKDLPQGTVVNDFVWVVAAKPGSEYEHNELRDFSHGTDSNPTLGYLRDKLLNKPKIFLGDAPYCVQCGLTLKAEKDRFNTANIERCGGIYLKKEVSPGTALTDDLLEEVPVPLCQQKYPDVVYKKTDVVGMHLSSTRVKTFPAGSLLKFSDF